MTYSRRHERERQNAETPERILRIVKSKGIFCVSLRYRDNWLRRRCKRLKKLGYLVGGRREGRQLVYRAAPNLDLI